MGSSGARQGTEAGMLACGLREVALAGGDWPMTSSSDATSIASSPHVQFPPWEPSPFVLCSIPLPSLENAGGGCPVSPTSMGSISAFSGIGVSTSESWVLPLGLLLAPKRLSKSALAVLEL